MVVRMKRCPHCGRTEPRDALACSGCRSAFAYRAPRHPVDPAVLPRPAQHVAPAPHDISCAVLASMFVPGAGQMYNLQPAKGAFLCLSSAAALILGIHAWSLFFLCLSAVAWIVSMLDAALIAGRLNDHEQVTPRQWF